MNGIEVGYLIIQVFCLKHQNCSSPHTEINTEYIPENIYNKCILEKIQYVTKVSAVEFVYVSTEK